MDFFNWLFGEGSTPVGVPLKEAAPIPAERCTLVIIHDTSHLMEGNPNPADDIREFAVDPYFTLNGISKGANYWENHARSYGLAGWQYNAAILSAVDIQHVVPVQVKQEVAKHFDDSDKQALAERVRGFLAKLIATERVDSPDLKSYDPIAPMDGILGPDSDVDRCLISLAIQRAGEPRTLVLLATCDSGIELDITMRRKAGLCQSLYTHSTYGQLVTALGFNRNLSIAFRKEEPA